MRPQEKTRLEYKRKKEGMAENRGQTAGDSAEAAGAVSRPVEVRKTHGQTHRQTDRWLNCTVMDTELVLGVDRAPPSISHFKVS